MQRSKVDLMFEERGRSWDFHWELFMCVVALILFGTIMVHSATTMFVDQTHSIGENHVMLKHLLSIGVGGLLCGAIYWKGRMIWIERITPYVFVLAVLMLFLVFIPGIGHKAKGAARWISFGFANFQVSEVMKVACIMMAAHYCSRSLTQMHSWFKVVVPMGMTIAVIAFLLMNQPDLGATVVISSEVLGVFFLAGLSLWIFSGGVIAAVVSFIALICITPWRLQRVFAFLDPWDEAYVLGKGYQLTHSLIAFGRGELFGVGLGGSVEKLYYLPEAHTDFILAVVAEETGFIGVVFVLLMYYWLIRYAFEIGRQAVKLERFYSGLVAQGIGVWFGVQSVINIGVATGFFPTKGLTLPFVSYGSSAMVMSLVAVGLLLRVDKENKILMRGGRVS